MTACTREGATPTTPTAPMPKVLFVTLDVVRSSGVVGSLPSGSTTFERGTAVDYNFTSREGFDHVRVSISGTNAPPAGRITLSQDTQLIVTADSVVVATVAQDVLADAYRAMFAGGDLAKNVRRVRELTNQMYATLPSRDAEQQVSLARISALEAADGPSVAQLMKVLSDSLFGAFNSSGTSASASAFGNWSTLAQNVASVTASGIGNVSPVTTFIFVNGVLNSELTFQRTVDNELAETFKIAGFSETPGRFRHLPFYNRSASKNAYVAALQCFDKAASKANESLFGALIDLPSCAGTIAGGAAGAVQVLSQILNSALGTVPALAQSDAKILTQRIRSALVNKGRVILIGHSQGNLFVNEALSVLAPNDDEKACIAVVGLAPPLSVYEAKGLAYAKSVIIEDRPAADLLLFLPSSVLATTWAAPISTAQSKAMASSFVTTSFFPYVKGYALHLAPDSYLSESGARERVVDELKKAVDATESSCGGSNAAATTARIRVISNVNTSWTLQPGGRTGAGQDVTLTVSPSPFGTYFTISPAVLPGAYVLVSTSDGPGNSIVVVSGQTKTITLTYQFQPLVQPHIIRVEPTPVLASATAQRITIVGSEFVAGATVVLRDLSSGILYPNRQIEDMTPTEIVINPIFGINASAWSVEVINPGNASSTPFIFQVAARSNTPTISGVNPIVIPTSSETQHVSVNGTGFSASASITLRDLRTGVSHTNVPISASSATRMSVDWTFGTTPGTWTVQVTNPGSVSSAEFPFSVVTAPSPPPPAISSVNPASPIPTGGNIAFTIAGSNFVSGANIVLRDLTTGELFPNRSPSSFSPTQIVINPNFGTATTAATAHTWSVEVINPGGATTGQTTFTVQAFPVSTPTPTPAISSVNPASPIPTGGNIAFTIAGSNFVSGANVVLRDLTTGDLFPNRSPSSFSPTQITINPNFGSATTAATAHTWSVEVINPSGATTRQTTFTVQAFPASTPTPAISSVSPASPRATGNPVAFTINGSNFVSGANIYLRDLTAGQAFPNRVASLFSSTQIIINPNFGSAATAATAHTWSIEVINPNGATTGQRNFTVQAF